MHTTPTPFRTPINHSTPIPNGRTR
jgi:hypothetical protein